jgi:hypothetical protein
MNKLIGILLLLLSSNLNAQLSRGEYFKEKYPDGSTLDAKVRTRFAGNLSESYFVITYPTIGASTTYVPQFLKAMKNIRSLNKKNTDVVVVFLNENGLRTQDIERFIREVLRQNGAAYDQLKWVVDQPLYEEIVGERSLLRLLYFYRRNLIYNEAEKWNSIRSYDLPGEYFELQAPKKVALKNIDEALILGTDALIPYKNGQLLLTTDLKDEVLVVDPKTGAVEKLFKITDYQQATDLYCALHAKGDADKCAYAKKYAEQWEKAGRQALNLRTAQYRANKIYGFYSLEAFESNESKYVFKNDENTTSTIEKGTPVLNGFGGIYVYDISKDQMQFYALEEPKGQKKNDEVYLNLDSGMYIDKEEHLFTSMSFYPLRKKTEDLAELELGADNIYRVRQFLPPYTDKKTEDYMGYNNVKDFFFLFDNTILMVYDAEGKIYQVGQEKPRSSFYGNGERPYAQQQYKVLADDQTPSKINFEIHAVAPVHENYLLSYYVYKGQPVFELKNRIFKTLDVVEAQHIPSFNKYSNSEINYNLLISDNTVYFLSVEADQVFLYQYEVKLLTG